MGGGGGVELKDRLGLGFFYDIFKWNASTGNISKNKSVSVSICDFLFNNRFVWRLKKYLSQTCVSVNHKNISVNKHVRNIYTLQRKNAKNWKQIFPEKEYRGLSPDFHIHVSVSELYMYTVRKMDLILSSIERMLKMQFSMARNFTLQPLRRYDVKPLKKTAQA